MYNYVIVLYVRVRRKCRKTASNGHRHCICRAMIMHFCASVYLNTAIALSVQSEAQTLDYSNGCSSLTTYKEV